MLGEENASGVEHSRLGGKAVRERQGLGRFEVLSNMAEAQT